MNSILTICTGNICRSPAAMFAFRQALPNWRIASAGTSALVGRDVDLKTKKAAELLELEIGLHSAQQLTAELALEYDFLLVMDNSHRRYIRECFPFALAKTHALGKFCSGIEIPDPYMRGEAAQIRAVSLIKENTSVWAEKLKELY